MPAELVEVAFRMMNARGLRRKIARVRPCRIDREIADLAYGSRQVRRKSAVTAETEWNARCSIRHRLNNPNNQPEEEFQMLYRTSLSAPVFGLRREIDRLFEDTFSRGDGVNNWSPAVDVSESDKEVKLELELPGINPEDVEITADNNVLTVRGEKHGERKEDAEDSRYHIVERSYGSFTRSFQLPQGLDDSKIQADCNNGILSIRIPKAALPQPRRIQIGQSASQSANRVSNGSQKSSAGIADNGKSKPQAAAEVSPKSRQPDSQPQGAAR
jgi:HSP20 family protein